MGIIARLAARKRFSLRDLGEASRGEGDAKEKPVFLWFEELQLLLWCAVETEETR